MYTSEIAAKKFKCLQCDTVFGLEATRFDGDETELPPCSACGSTNVLKIFVNELLSAPTSPIGRRKSTDRGLQPPPSAGAGRLRGDLSRPLGSSPIR